jgi:hypothetical protein
MVGWGWAVKTEQELKQLAIERLAGNLTLIYARVSTADKGQEVENQLLQLREFCRVTGWSIVREYVDHETGGRGDEPYELWRDLVNEHDEKWVNALRPYVGGGLVPFYRAADGSIDAVKTINSLMRLKGCKMIGPNGEDVEIP